MTTMNETQIAASVVRFARASCGLRGVRGLTAHRVTGSPGLGGIWQCYVPAPGGGLNSRGPNIHATSDGECARRAS